MGMQRRPASLAGESCYPLRLSLKEGLDVSQTIENLPATTGSINSNSVSKCYYPLQI
jgi:hypothetical protein